MAIPPFFDQITGVAEASWYGNREGLAEMERKGWVILENEWNIDLVKTATATLQSLQENMSLFQRPQFCASLLDVFKKLNPYQENETAIQTATKTTYLYLTQKDSAAFPLDTQLFLLKEAMKRRDISTALTLFSRIPITDPFLLFMNREIRLFNDFMRYLAMNRIEAAYNDLFRHFHSFRSSLYVYCQHHLQKNPFLNTEAYLASEASRNGYCLESSPVEDWTSIKIIIKHRNEHFKISFNFASNNVADASDEKIISEVRDWIDKGMPHKEVAHFKTSFLWTPTIDQLARMLQKKQFVDFDEQLRLAGFSDTGYLGLCGNLCTKSLLKEYFLNTDRGLEDSELDYLFDQIGTMDLDAALRFFHKSLQRCNIDRPLQLKWLSGVLTVFSGIIKLYNHENEPSNLPLIFIKGREWDFANLILNAGWNPLLCKEGQRELEETLMEMAKQLKNMDGYCSNLSKKYARKDLPFVHALLPRLLSLIPNGVSLEAYQTYKINYFFQGYSWEYQIHTRIVLNGQFVNPVEYVKKINARHPDLTLYIIENNREAIDAKTLSLYLDRFLFFWDVNTTTLKAAKRLIELGAPLGKVPDYFYEKQYYINPLQTLLKTLTSEHGEINPVDSPLYLELLELLLPADYPFDEKKKSVNGAGPLTRLETFYLNQKLPRPFAFEVLLLMIRKGATLTDRLVQRLNEELATTPHEEMEACLRRV